MLIKYSKFVIVAIFLLAVLSFIPISNLKLDFNIENFFPVNDPDLEFFEDFKKHFHTDIDDEYIFIGLKNNNGIFDKSFLTKADSLSKSIQRLDNILRVYSITHTGYVFVKNGKLNEGPIIHISQPELYKQDSIDLFQSDEYRSLLISKDGKSIAITAFNAPKLSDSQKDNILDSIQRQIDILGFDESHVTAKIRIERTYVSEIEKNLKVYILVSFLLLSLVLLILFRSFKAIVLPIVTIVISISFTLALIALLDYPVDIISSLIPPVLAVVCMSNVIHITTKYFEELKNGESKKAALKRTFKDIGLATFYASLTTAIGFYTLSVSNVLPIKLFGFFAGTGVLMAFIVATSLTIAAFANSKKPKIVNSDYFNKNWLNFLSAAFRHLITNKYRILGIWFLLIILSAYYIGKIQINTSMLQEIPKNNTILADYKFIENNFAGTRPFELALILKDTNDVFLNLEILREIEVVEKFIKDSCGVGFLISPLTFIKGANKAFTGGNNNNYKLPNIQRDVYTFTDKIMFTGWGRDLFRFLTQDGKHARISGKLPDLTIEEFNTLNKKFNTFFNSQKKTFHFNYKMTGSAVLIDKISYSLTNNMFMGLLIAFCAISFIVVLMFRSVKMVLIVLIPNIIPLLIMAGVMGMLGIDLKADTSIIFAVAFGIVVDDTIHFLSRFKIELKERTVIYALKRAYLSTGKAMIITTIILLAGFGSLLFSSFSGTFYIGLLISLSLIIALVIDLTLLPLLILFFYRKR